MKVLLTSADPVVREMVGLAITGLERRIGEPLRFLEAEDGKQGLRIAWRERPHVVVADEIASRAGAFAMARDLRGAEEPYRGIIVILLERPEDTWLAKWSGADAWFTKPVDPFELVEKVGELLADRMKESA